MKKVLVIFIKNKRIDKIRKIFDPRFKDFKSHISLVYPFYVSDKKQLDKHIRDSIKKLKPFHIVLNGLKKSAKEYYLYLLIKKGNSHIKLLYKNFNSGILKNFKNKDMPKYIPHVSLGVFKNKIEINNAIKEIKKEKLKVECTVDKISLLTLRKNHSIKSVKNFKLK